MKTKKIKIILIILLLGTLFLLGMAGKVDAMDSDGNLVIVLDPGHGGGDPGATGGNLREDEVNFKIAYYAKEELEQYEGVKVYLTRYNNNPSIYDRVEIAKNYNADLLVSLHINSGASSARGAAIWVTQDNTQVEYKQKATELGNTILYHIGTLGVRNNGVQIRSGQPDEWYDSGVVQDYYGIIRYAQRIKLRSLLVEHCFISNANDREYINSDEKLRKMAQADVKGIVEAYGLQRKGQGFIPIKTMDMEQQELNLQIQNNDLQPVAYVNPIINPGNASNQNLEWYSSNPEVVRVWNGRIRGLQQGEAVIKAISKNNQRIATCKVVVTKPKVPLQNITTTTTEQTVNIDETGDIYIDFYPNDCDDKILYWKSSKPEIVRVWNGHYRGLKEGISIITAYSRAGGKQASCKVKVKDANKVYVENVEFEQEEYTVDIDEAINLPFSYTPANSENAEFMWSSSNPEILRVSNNRFRGLKEGTAEIIVQTTDGMFEKRIKVTVKNLNKPYVQDLEIEKEKYVININEAVDLPFTYTPINSKNAEFVWSSSNPEILRVWNNRFRGLKEGIAEVIVKTFDGRYEKKIKVVVKNPNKMYVEDVKLEQNEFTVKVNEAVDLLYSYSPSESENAEFIWSSSNLEILRVWNNRFRGLKEGTAYVVIRTVDETFEKKIKVTIEK